MAKLQMEQVRSSIEYVFLIVCTRRLLPYYMRIHSKKIASITNTFGRVSYEMLKFMFAFFCVRLNSGPSQPMLGEYFGPWAWM
eukprot:scaffold479881_cov18-Prasinocladus_malaysianus.AAC.3